MNKLLTTNRSRNFQLLIFIYLLFFTTNMSFSQTGIKYPKNIILMISDGCGYNHIAATNMYQYGYVNAQSYEKFPTSIGMSTYPARTGSYSTSGSTSALSYNTGYNSFYSWSNFRYNSENFTESGAAATAIASGVKTYNNSINMDINFKPLTTVTERAKELGKSTGVITSVQLSHATPAGFGAHNLHRNNYSAIAKEMIQNSKIDVIMGCGHPMFDDNGMPGKKTYQYVGDSLLWHSLASGSLAQVQDIDGDGTPDQWSLIQDRSQFQSLGYSSMTPKRVLGVSKVHTTLQQARSGDIMANPFVTAMNKDVPTLEEMTRSAINVLDNNPKGFFIMIEGGAIDWASHAGQSGRMIEEEVDFNNSVNAVIDWVSKNSNWDETLLIVTADHECGYLWGPNSDVTPLFKSITNNGKGKLPGMQWFSDEHTNSLVPLFAKGAGSELFKLYADEKDSVKGDYINNTEVGQIIMDVMPKNTIPNPKNIIFLISDGWSYNEVLMTDYYQHGKAGEQVYEKFPIKFGMSTYPARAGDYKIGGITAGLTYNVGYNPQLAWKTYDYLKSNYTESAATATALSTGVKTYNNSIGLDINFLPLINLTQQAKSLNKSAGVVSTVQFSHATPAGFVAHNEHRNNYAQIAQEMLLDSKLDVIIGCGNPNYNDNGEFVLTQNDAKYVGGKSVWNGLWSQSVNFDINGDGFPDKAVQDCDQDGTPDPWTLIQDRWQFQGIAKMSTTIPKRLLGIPKVYSTTNQARSGNSSADPFIVSINQGAPTLSEMSLASLNVLNRNRNGFFLMIEGGAIDWANHANQAGRSIEEQIDFNKTVEGVIDWVEKYSSWDQTMVIVTGDHECGLVLGPNSNNSLWEPVVNNGVNKLPGVAFNSMDHTNSLIPFFAKGAGSEVFKSYADESDSVRGSYINNTEIPQAIFKIWGKSNIYYPKMLSVKSDEKLKTIDLKQNYPNPFNPSTLISYSLPAKSKITLSIYNALGQKLETLIDKEQAPGSYSISWNGTKYASGLYFYKIEAGNYTNVKKMLLVK